MRSLFSFIVRAAIRSTVIIQPIDGTIRITAASKAVAVAVVSLALAIAVVSTQLPHAQLAQTAGTIITGQTIQIRVVVSAVAHAVAESVVAELILIRQIRATEAISAETAGIATGQTRHTETILIAAGRSLIRCPWIDEIAISARLK